MVEEEEGEGERIGNMGTCAWARDREGGRGEYEGDKTEQREETS